METKSRHTTQKWYKLFTNEITFLYLIDRQNCTKELRTQNKYSVKWYDYSVTQLFNI